jgi:hypothetical protein
MLIEKYASSERISNIRKKISSGLFFNQIIVISIEGHLTFLIAGYLNYDKPLSTETGEIISKLVT